MALEYSLSIHTDLGPAELLRLLFPGGTPQPAPKGSGAILNTEHLHASAMRHAPGPISPLQEELGIEPTASVLFRLDKFRDTRQGRTEVIRATVAFLSQRTEDAALLFNGEIVLLARRQGLLTVNPSCGFWDDASDLALLPKPYEVRSLAVL